MVVVYGKRTYRCTGHLAAVLQVDVVPQHAFMVLISSFKLASLHQEMMVNLEPTRPKTTMLLGYCDSDRSLPL